MTIALEAGEWSAEIRPEIGGSLSALRFRGLDLLRPMPPGAADPLRSACFPLVPWCNRIREGRFAFAGREVALPANFPPEPHGLRGLGWRRAWRVEGAAGRECALVDHCDGSGPWPWAYRAEQRIRLGERGCAVVLTLTNRAGEPMPCGLGLHPYFRRRPVAGIGGGRFTARTPAVSYTRPICFILPDDPRSPPARRADDRWRPRRGHAFPDSGTRAGRAWTGSGQTPWPVRTLGPFAPGSGAFVRAGRRSGNREMAVLPFELAGSAGIAGQAALSGCGAAACARFRDT